MKDKIRSFMAGRYGHDELNYFLLALGIIFMFLSLIFGRVFSLMSMLALVFVIFRMMSRNFSSRAAENRRFMPLWSKVAPHVNIMKARMKDGGVHRYFLCPKCKKILRVPKGKGKITLHCPCGTDFKGKS